MDELLEDGKTCAKAKISTPTECYIMIYGSMSGTIKMVSSVNQQVQHGPLEVHHKSPDHPIVDDHIKDHVTKQHEDLFHYTDHMATQEEEETEEYMTFNEQRRTTIQHKNVPQAQSLGQFIVKNRHSYFKTPEDQRRAELEETRKRDYEKAIEDSLTRMGGI